jgi:hypothetical protein
MNKSKQKYLYRNLSQKILEETKQYKIRCDYNIKQIFFNKIEDIIKKKYVDQTYKF